MGDYFLSNQLRSFNKFSIKYPFKRTSDLIHHGSRERDELNRGETKVDIGSWKEVGFHVVIEDLFLGILSLSLHIF